MTFTRLFIGIVPKNKRKLKWSSLMLIIQTKVKDVCRVSVDDQTIFVRVNNDKSDQWPLDVRHSNEMVWYT